MDCLAQYRQGRAEQMTQYNKKYWQETKEEQGVRHRRWREENREHVNSYQREYVKQWAKHKSSTDPAYRIVKNLRHRLWSAVKSVSGKKQGHTLDFLACSRDQLLTHLEKQFSAGMSWENYGEWHIDHKKPCAAFDMTVKEEQAACFHYTNLQPLWAKDNLSKGAKWEEAESSEDEF